MCIISTFRSEHSTDVNEITTGPLRLCWCLGFTYLSVFSAYFEFNLLCRGDAFQTGLFIRYSLKSESKKTLPYSLYVWLCWAHMDLLPLTAQGGFWWMPHMHWSSDLIFWSKNEGNGVKQMFLQGSCSFSHSICFRICSTASGKFSQVK